MNMHDIKNKILDAKDVVVAKTKDAACATKNWAQRNPYAAAAIGAVVLKGATTIAKDSYRNHKIQKEEDHRDSRIYDRKVDMWYETRRPLNNREKQKLAERYSAGESKYYILKDMHLLK